jgi:hypothetical protein
MCVSLRMKLDLSLASPRSLPRDEEAAHGFADGCASERAEDQMPPLQRPGELPQQPGEYVERGPRGGEVPRPREVTIEPGDKPLPPTREPNRTWEWVSPPQSGRKPRG